MGYSLVMAMMADPNILFSIYLSIFFDFREEQTLILKLIECNKL